jgi:hypothetical protein
MEDASESKILKKKLTHRNSYNLLTSLSNACTGSTVGRLSSSGSSITTCLTLSFEMFEGSS